MEWFQPDMEWAQMDLAPELLNNIEKLGWTKPRPIQRLAIATLRDRSADLIATAPTGSGKTGAMLIPIIHYLMRAGRRDKPRGEIQMVDAIIVAPTRQLATQIFDVALRLCTNTGIRANVAYGQANSREQIMSIREGTNILVGTVGRLLDFIYEGVINTAQIQFVILDEADRMLDMGFQECIECIFHMVPGGRRKTSAFFSTTFPESVQAIGAEFMNTYATISV